MMLRRRFGAERAPLLPGGLLKHCPIASSRHASTDRNINLSRHVLLILAIREDQITAFDDRGM